MPFEMGFGNQFAAQKSSTGRVACRSIATGRGKLQVQDVRNAPLATVGPKKAACRDGPQAEVTGLLFDDIVGERDELIRNGEAERLGSLEVDD